MQKNISVLITSIFVLISHEPALAVSPINNLPAETLILRLPGQESDKWKEACRWVKENEGEVRWIPNNQVIGEASSTIIISFHDLATIERQKLPSIKERAEMMEKAIEYDKSRRDLEKRKVIYKIIEKNQNDLIYECTYLRTWVRSAPRKSLPPQHTIARIVETSNGMHTIAVAQKDSMSAGERKKWIKILKENVFVTAYEAAARGHEGFSLADPILGSLDLGEVFCHWQAADMQIMDNGHARVRYCPFLSPEAYFLEQLEVITWHNVYNDSLDKILEQEKSFVEKTLNNKVEFHFLKKTPTEVIYRCSRQDDLLKVSAVVRTFISAQGVYSLCYWKKGPTDLTEKEILQVRGNLEAIKICKKPG